MSLRAGSGSSSCNMTLEDSKKDLSWQNNGEDCEGRGDDGLQFLGRQMSETSLIASDEEEDDEANMWKKQGLELGPMCTLKEQIEKDKDDESLRKWKEQLLGSLDLDNIGEKLEPRVQFHSFTIVSFGRPDIKLSIPNDGNPVGTWFSLKEGITYQLKFSFTVSGNIVSGLKYTNETSKQRYLVLADRIQIMLGNYAPVEEVQTYLTTETYMVPSGPFARGKYVAKSKFSDDDKKCHLRIKYAFEIVKDDLAC